MLNKEQLRKQVIQYFRSVGSGENIVQCIKEALFLHQKFNPVILFEVISRGKQKISKQDWRQYFLHRNIAFNEDQIKYFFSINSFADHITLNEFLESMIPYNADVIRQFKAKYLDSLQIRQFDVEVQFIFSQLLSNWIKFIRSIMKIRSQITKIATKKQIEQLIKEDLVLKSKPREARKFHQNFQTRDFSGLSFHELRKFLELWVSSKEIIHQFYLLNVKRHIKSENPFEKIVFKNNKVSKSKGEKQRSLSAYKISNKVNLTNEKLKEKVEFNDRKFDTVDMRFQNCSADKYDEYKKEIMEDFVKQKHGLGKSVQKSSNRKQYEREQSYGNNQNEVMIRQSRYQREQKGIDGTYIVNIFEQIVRKEERLQKLRKHLAKLNDFNLINLFRLVDHKNQGFITIKDLSDFTGDNRVQFNYLIQFYARQKNKLRFHEFCIFFRPLSKQLNDIIDGRPEHKVPNPFKRQTSKLILQVLHLSAEMHSNLMRIREKINREGIDPFNLFRHIDLGDKGYISADCMKTVLEENNIFCEARDLKCLMKFFRKKVDERISPQQFVSFIDI